MKRVALVLFVLLPILAGASPLDLYAELTGKTLIAAPSLPKLSDSLLKNLPEDKTNATALIDAEFKKLGIAVVQDGPHFIRLVRAELLESHLADVPLRGSELQRASSEMVPSGMVHFINTDLETVLILYAELSRRNVLRRVALVPASGLNFKTTCRLSREELIYAMSTLLALNGVAAVSDGDLFVQAVPTVQRAEVSARAPKRKAEEPVIDLKDIPTFGSSDPAYAVQSTDEPLKQKAAQRRTAWNLLEYYAELTGKTAVPSPQFDPQPIWFRMQQPVSRSELLYAIETTFRLNHLSIVPDAHGQIRLGRPSGSRGPNSNQ